MNNYKSPLNLYVLWHPTFQDGKIFSDNIYKNFCRNSEQPLSRQIGIPTFFRSASAESSATPIPVKLEDADRNAFVLLIDENMFNDQAWEGYIGELIDSISASDCDRIYPISLDRHAFRFCEDKLSEYQFISLEKIVGDEKVEKSSRQRKELVSRLLHDLSRQMMNQESVAESDRSDSSAIPEPPVKLFISHAKKDGLKVASEFRNYIHSETKLKTFFDANDIADGYNFEDEISRVIDGRTALVVFHTDEYSDREWCRIEVIHAKRIKSPIVVVYDISKGEKRSFPYMGNVPTIKWDDNFADIIELTLYQVLNNRFNEEYLKKHIKLYGLDTRHECIELTSPPELFNYLLILKKSANMEAQGSKKDIMVIYPDPPLGIEELRVLNEVDDNIHFTTPTYTFQFL